MFDVDVLKTAAALLDDGNRRVDAEAVATRMPEADSTSVKATLRQLAEHGYFAYMDNWQSVIVTDVLPAGRQRMAAETVSGRAAKVARFSSPVWVGVLASMLAAVALAAIYRVI